MKARFIIKPPDSTENIQCSASAHALFENKPGSPCLARCRV